MQQRSTHSRIHTSTHQQLHKNQITRDIKCTLNL
jgi:hypothetical protein